MCFETLIKFVAVLENPSVGHWLNLKATPPSRDDQNSRQAFRKCREPAAVLRAGYGLSCSEVGSVHSPCYKRGKLKHREERSHLPGPGPAAGKWEG